MSRLGEPEPEETLNAGGTDHEGATEPDQPASSPCPQCGAAVEPGLLLCPQCGKAQIPQFNQKDLRDLRDRYTAADARVRKGTVLGLGIGFLLGLVSFGVLLSLTENPEFSDSWSRLLPGSIIMCTILGGLAGALGTMLRNRWGGS